jgi:hypothetical protein
VVIDVALFLKFAYQAATAVTAGDQTGEGKVMLLLLAPATTPLLYDRLDPLPQASRNYRLVGAPVRLAVEIEITRVDPFVQDLVYRRL